MLKLTLLADRLTVTVLLTHIFAEARPMRANNAKYIVPEKSDAIEAPTGKIDAKGVV